MNARKSSKRVTTEKQAKALSAWEVVKISRHPGRPVFQDYLERICTDFTELHGDRYYADDQALIGGFARIGGLPVMVIGHNKGKNTEEQVARNFGMAKPEGYRKALRLMRIAERFRIPVISFIDTPGAFPGIEAEERGQAESIARNITEMAGIRVPILCVVIGEGGSGGALGIGVGDRVLMLSNAIYSVISPEGCASILWRDAGYAPDAAEALNLTATSLLRLGVIDEIIAEPGPGAHEHPDLVAQAVQQALEKALHSLRHTGTERLLQRRYAKFAAMGQFAE
jgi:acetyl-CoA carboxylase carboxyl transferase subunit alpha